MRSPNTSASIAMKASDAASVGTSAATLRPIDHFSLDCRTGQFHYPHAGSHSPAVAIRHGGPNRRLERPSDQPAGMSA